MRRAPNKAAPGYIRELIRLQRAHQDTQKYLYQILEERGCLRCGTHDVRVLTFHHRNPAEKEYGLHKMGSFGWETLQKELAKCDVLCRNCHAIIHWEVEQ